MMDCMSHFSKRQKLLGQMTYSRFVSNYNNQYDYNTKLYNQNNISSSQCEQSPRSKKNIMSSSQSPFSKEYSSIPNYSLPNLAIPKESNVNFSNVENNNDSNHTTSCTLNNETNKNTLTSSFESPVFNSNNYYSDSSSTPLYSSSFNNNIVSSINSDYSPKKHVETCLSKAPFLSSSDPSYSVDNEYIANDNDKLLNKLDQCFSSNNLSSDHLLSSDYTKLADPNDPYSFSHSTKSNSKPYDNSDILFRKDNSLIKNKENIMVSKNNCKYHHGVVVDSMVSYNHSDSSLDLWSEELDDLMIQNTNGDNSLSHRVDDIMNTYGSEMENMSQFDNTPSIQSINSQLLTSPDNLVELYESLNDHTNDDVLTGQSICTLEQVDRNSRSDENKSNDFEIDDLILLSPTKSSCITSKNSCINNFDSFSDLEFLSNQTLTPNSLYNSSEKNTKPLSMKTPKSKESPKNNHQDVSTCPVCFSTMSEVDYIGRLPTCSHVFCFDCIFKWSEVSNKCPLCKSSFNAIYKWIQKSNRNEELVDKIDVEEKNIPVAEEGLEEYVCRICFDGSHEEVLLLCDGCDDAYHTYCVGLTQIPSGSWYCQTCRPYNASIGRTLMQEVINFWENFHQTTTNSQNASNRTHRANSRANHRANSRANQRANSRANPLLDDIYQIPQDELFDIERDENILLSSMYFNRNRHINSSRYSVNLHDTLNEHPRNVRSIRRSNRRRASHETLNNIALQNLDRSYGRPHGNNSSSITNRRRNASLRDNCNTQGVQTRAFTRMLQAEREKSTNMNSNLIVSDNTIDSFECSKPTLKKSSSSSSSGRRYRRLKRGDKSNVNSNDDQTSNEFNQMYDLDNRNDDDYYNKKKSKNSNLTRFNQSVSDNHKLSASNQQSSSSTSYSISSLEQRIRRRWTNQSLSDNTTMYSKDNHQNRNNRNKKISSNKSHKCQVSYDHSESSGNNIDSSTSSTLPFSHIESISLSKSTNPIKVTSHTFSSSSSCLSDESELFFETDSVSSLDISIPNKIKKKNVSVKSRALNKKRIRKIKSKKNKNKSKFSMKSKSTKKYPKFYKKRNIN